MLRKVILIFVIALFISGVIFAQDFGFGSEDDEESPSKPSVSFTVGGEISAEAIPYTYDFNNDETPIDSFWNVKLDLAFTSPYIDIFSSSNFNPDSINELWTGSIKSEKWNYTPLIIDELYFRVYISAVNFELGYRKLTWGKVDSNGPLDVINPIDYSDLIDITDIKGRKIARPLFHLTWNAGSFSKLEGVFIPNFTGHRFALEGRWAAAQSADMMKKTEEVILDRLRQRFGDIINNFFSSDSTDYSFESPFPDTSGIEYFQAGLRFTTTVSSADLGIQYFYGNLFRPNYSLTDKKLDAFIDDLISKNIENMAKPDAEIYTGDMSLLDPIKYTRYHQIGIDYAQVLLGFNVRAEAAINITEDYNGDNGALQNPFVAWAFGFDRDLFWGINANVQCDETIRLFNDKVGDNPLFDSEAGTDMTNTRISLHLSKSFFRDKLELGITGVWEIEVSDFYIIPSITWTQDNLTLAIGAGIFLGNTEGELGQYWHNRFMKFALSIVF
jgi:hypothetical protein